VNTSFSQDGKVFLPLLVQSWSRDILTRIGLAVVIGFQAAFGSPVKVIIQYWTVNRFMVTGPVARPARLGTFLE